MNPDEEPLDPTRVAEAVSDGLPVDWSHEDPAGSDRSVLGHLRAIESIAAIHRPESGSEVATDARQPDEPEQGLETWGTLVLLEHIGTGGFGDVYRAHDPALQREVALKLFRTPEGGGNRYLDEARRLARVRHPNVIVAHGADEHAGRVGMWTELLHGPTLAEWISRHGLLAPREAAIIGMEMCRALAAVHAAGLVHRDVKLENIVREEGGRLVLLDFGAVDVPSAEPLSRVELGTPITMAPEQLRGGPVGPAADIYGLGVALYRLVTGKYPMEATTLPELAEGHRTGAIVPLRNRRPDLPTEFVGVVERALEADPKRRFSSTGEMERALAAVAGVEPARSGVSPSRTRLAMWLALVVAIGAAVWAGRAGLRSRVARPSPAPLPSALSAITARATVFRDGATGAVPLQSGDGVNPGDALFMRIRSDDSMYVYVLDEDEKGSIHALYPIAGVTPANPLPAHDEHRLPGSLGGEPFDWQVTSAGGAEDICVIASRAPIPSLEAEIATFPHARPGAPTSYGRFSTRAVERLRGIDGMTPAPAPGGGGHHIADLVRSLETTPRNTNDPWIWSMTLENPGPK